MNISTTKQNLVIFTIVTLSSGWIGAWVNTVVPSPSPQQSLRILIFLLLPFLTVFVLRGFGKDGWKDFGLRLNLKGNLGWYALALLVYPLTIFLTLGLGAIFGWFHSMGCEHRVLGLCYPSSVWVSPCPC